MITTTAAVERDREDGSQVRERVRALVAAMHEEAAARERESAGEAAGEAAPGSQGDREPAARAKRQRKPWKPTGRDELIYQWVRMEGKTQQWVASALDISQATVSRTLRRLEKWQAHAQPGADGSLDRAERQRMQWQLTYERNERIMTSALRLADEMEFPRDMEKSVTVRPNLPTTDERMIRRESFVQDRSGMIARFLRLAFRVNMEQLKLVDREPEPLAPLTADEQAACAAESAADLAEVAAQDQQRADEEELRRRIESDVQLIVAGEVERRLAAWEEGRRAAGSAEDLAGSKPAPGEPRAGVEVASPGADLVAAEEETPAPGLVPARDEDQVEDKTSRLKLHKVHNAGASEIDASNCPDSGCGEPDAAVKNELDTCMVALAGQPDAGDGQSIPTPAMGGACETSPPGELQSREPSAVWPRGRVRLRQATRLARIQGRVGDGP